MEEFKHGSMAHSRRLRTSICSTLNFLATKDPAEGRRNGLKCTVRTRCLEYKGQENNGGCDSERRH